MDVHVSVPHTQLLNAGNIKKQAAMISSHDAEPVVGFAAFLPEYEWKVVRLCTADWIVRAKSYVDTIWISREDILDCFEKSCVGRHTATVLRLLPLLGFFCAPPGADLNCCCAVVPSCSSVLDVVSNSFAFCVCTSWPDGLDSMVDHAYELYEPTPTTTSLATDQIVIGILFGFITAVQDSQSLRQVPHEPN